MKKLLAAVLTSLLLLTSASLVFAQKPEDSSNPPGIPEQNGDYPDPAHPGLRVHVFVHPASRPGTTTPSSLICTDDPPSSAQDGWAGWKLPSGNWTYNLNPSSVPGTVGPNNLGTITANGFGAWQAALSSSSTKPNLVQGADTTVIRASYDGIHVITWGRTSGNALGVTYVWYYTDTHLVAEVDTIMNKKFSWSWNGGGLCNVNTDTYDAQDILTHEQGHWYGLDDEYASSYANNTMFGYGSKGEIKKDTPTAGDINGLNAIYQ